MEKLSIFSVEKNRDLREFILLPWKIYKNNTHWVAPLIINEKETFNYKKHPFFNHSDVRFFIAKKHGEIVGRIAAIINYKHNQYYTDKTGFFGFFEVINDFSVAKGLLVAAEDWIKKKGMNLIRGPMSYSTNEMCGLLIEGFEYKPCIMMPYNPSYYKDFLERLGFKKAKDLYTYYLDISKNPPERFIKIAERVKKNEKITIRAFNPKRFYEEIEIIKDIYNDAWSNNWGFVPFTEEEFYHLAQQLKQIYDPNLVLFAEKEGYPIAFYVVLPDINQAFEKINGRLFPFGIFKLLYYSKKITNIRQILLGARKGYQNTGVSSLFHIESWKIARRFNYKTAELGWILEDNHLVLKAAESAGGYIFKKHRIFDKTLN